MWFSCMCLQTQCWQYTCTDFCWPICEKYVDWFGWDWVRCGVLVITLARPLVPCHRITARGWSDPMSRSTLELTAGPWKCKHWSLLRTVTVVWYRWDQVPKLIVNICYHNVHFQRRLRFVLGRSCYVWTNHWSKSVTVLADNFEMCFRVSWIENQNTMNRMQQQRSNKSENWSRQYQYWI